MKRLLLFVVFLLFAQVVLAQSPTIVTGTVQGPNAVPATSGYVEFTIIPQSSSIVYYVMGTTTVAPSVGRCGIDMNGQIMSVANLVQPCQVWANTVITPGNTTYRVAYAPNNTVTTTVDQVQIFGATYNLNAPTFAPIVNIVPQYQTITTSPVAVNLIPAAAHAFNVGNAGAPYAAGYFDSLFVNGMPVGGGGGGSGNVNGNGTPNQIATWTATPNTITGQTVPNCGDATHALSYLGGTFGCQTIAGGGTGTVTNITTTAPLTGGSITTSGTIGIQQASGTQNGFLAASDWNTFNNKISTAVTSLIVAGPLTGGTITGTGTIGCPPATASTPGCLSAADWSSFNAKGTGTITGGGLTAGRLVTSTAATAIANGDLTGDVTTSGSTATTAVRVNGVTFPASPALDQVPVIAAANAVTWKSVPNCGDATHALSYNTTTHNWACQAITAGGNVTSGVMLTANRLIKGNGTTDLTVGDLAGDVTTAGSMVATVVNVNGVAYPAAPATDGVPVVTASNTVNYRAVTNCGDSTHALSYNTTTHTWGCQAITAAATAGGATTQLQYNNATALGGVTGVTSNGTNLTFASNSLLLAGGTSGTTTLNAIAAASGVLTVPAATDTLVARNTTDTLLNKTFDNSNIYTTRADRITLQDNVDTTKQARFSLAAITTGTTPIYALPNGNTTLVGTTTTQALTNKTFDATETYNFTGDVTSAGATLTVGRINGVTYPAAPATNSTPMVTAANTVVYKAVPSCSAVNSALSYNTGTNAYGCNVADRYILGTLIGANFNSTGDQSITMPSGNWVLRRVIITNASASLTTARGGLYTAASKGGTTLVPAAQAYSFLTTATNLVDAVLTNSAQDVRFSSGTVFLSLTTAQGASATADVYVIGERLN